jgi:hypothetical protein
MSNSPAPWSYRKEDGFAGEHDRYIYDANGEALMSDTPYYPWCSSNEDDWPLIAAAPELLEAAKSAETVLVTMRVLGETLSMLQTAIAKAEARS